MKIKLKINKDSIVGFAMQNGEKVLFAVGAICFLLFVFYAFRRETLSATQQPEELIDAVRKARAGIQNSKWEPGDEVKVVEYAKSAKQTQIDPLAVVFPVPFDPPLVSAKQKRSDPPLLAVEKLQVHSGFGAFENKITDAGGGGGTGPAKPTAKLEARTWAVITAIVPVTEQTNAFDRAFDPSATMGSSKDDVPFYTGSIVQRVEITNENVSTPPDKLEWQTLSYKSYAIERQKWTKDAAEIVDKEYLDPLFTHKLGPLVGSGGWNALEDDVSHAPEMPAASRRAREERKKQDGGARRCRGTGR